jgi:formyltetrahydrofolate synthetase
LKSDIEIAREAELRTIETIATKLGISDEYLELYGKFKAKVDLSINREKLKDHKNGKLILVTAISPTPAGVGKTTTSVGLVDGLCHRYYLSISTSRSATFHAKTWPQAWLSETNHCFFTNMTKPID